MEAAVAGGSGDDAFSPATAHFTSVPKIRSFPLETTRRPACKGFDFRIGRADRRHLDPVAGCDAQPDGRRRRFAFAESGSVLVVRFDRRRSTVQTAGCIPPSVMESFGTSVASVGGPVGKTARAIMPALMRGEPSSSNSFLTRIFTMNVRDRASPSGCTAITSPVNRLSRRRALRYGPFDPASRTERNLPAHRRVRPPDPDTRPRQRGRRR